MAGEGEKRKSEGKKRIGVRNLVCGGVAGAISRTLVSPLERLKILHQVQYLSSKGSAEKYGSVVSSLRTIVKEEGWRGFYKGNGINCVRVFPYVGIQFFCFEQIGGVVSGGKKGRDNRPLLTPLEKLGVGASAGICSVIATYPLDTVRGRLTAQGGTMEVLYDGMFDAMRKIAKAEGISAFYKGVRPTLVGIGPYVGINFLVYETLKEHAPVEEGARGPSAIWLAACGGVAGVSGQTASYPADLLRRRFQLQEMQGSKVAYDGVLNAVRTIIAEEGVRGLYKGFAANFIKVTPTIASMFFVNDLLRRSPAVNAIFGTA